MRSRTRPIVDHLAGRNTPGHRRILDGGVTEPGRVILAGRVGVALLPIGGRSLHPIGIRFPTAWRRHSAIRVPQRRRLRRRLRRRRGWGGTSYGDGKPQDCQEPQTKKNGGRPPPPRAFHLKSPSLAEASTEMCRTGSRTLGGYCTGTVLRLVVLGN